MLVQIKQAFRARFVTTLNAGTVTHVPGVFFYYCSNNGYDDHLRLFRKPTGGIKIVHWNQINNEWAKITVWNLLGFATLGHVDAGPDAALKHTTTPGWHFSFARIIFKREYRGFSLRWSAANPGFNL